MRKSEIGTAAFGKRQEYRAVAELLNRGYDVYMPLVDDKQIDCVLRIDDNRYLDIQIKARSKHVQAPGVFTGKCFKPRDTYFFIFYSEPIDTYWIIPSRKLKEYVKFDINGRFPITLASKVKGKDKICPRKKYLEYKNNFELLK